MSEQTQKFGTLFIVATPIGNLSDITLRAIEVLKSVDIVACEDTRVSKKLLDHLGIEKKMMSLHQHSTGEKYDIIVHALERGLDIAYITDGGTPGISDPGTFLIKKVQETNSKIQETKNNQISNSNTQKGCHSRLDRESTNSLSVDPRRSLSRTMIRGGNDIKIIPIPGPSAVVSAVSVSGMVEKEFYFAGFLPKKKGRQTKWKMLITLDCPIVIYESAIRLPKTLNDIQEYFGENTEVFIAREMTKMFEEYWGGNISEVISDLNNHTLKGEIVLIVKSS